KDNELSLVARGPGFLDEAKAVQPRHARVGDDQLKIAGVFRDATDCGASIHRDLDVVTGGSQRLRKHIKHDGVIVRPKNAEGLGGLDHLWVGSTLFDPLRYCLCNAETSMKISREREKIKEKEK